MSTTTLQPEIIDFAKPFFQYGINGFWKPDYGLQMDFPGHTETFDTAQAVQMLYAAQAVNLRNAGWPGPKPLSATETKMIVLPLSFQDIAQYAAQYKATGQETSPFQKAFQDAAGSANLSSLNITFLIPQTSAAALAGAPANAQLGTSPAIPEKIIDKSALIIAQGANISIKGLSLLHAALTQGELASPGFLSGNVFYLASLYADHAKTRHFTTAAKGLITHEQPGQPLFKMAGSLRRRTL